MRLSDIMCQPRPELKSDSSFDVIKFTNRDKCLISLFWQLIDSLDDGKKAIIIMERKEDLEYFNYMLSRYELTDLTLYAKGEELLTSPYFISRLKHQANIKQLSNEVKEYERLQLQFDNLSRQAHGRIKKLRLPAVGQLSVPQLHLKAKNSPIKSEINVEIDHNNYQSKKQLYQKAEKIYRNDYRFVEMQNPINAESCLDIHLEGLLSLIHDLQDTARDLLFDYKVLEDRVKFDITHDRQKGHEVINDHMDVIEELIGESPLSTTSKTKLQYHSQEILEKIGDYQSLDMSSDGIYQYVTTALENYKETNTKTIAQDIEMELGKINKHTSTDVSIKAFFESVEQFKSQIKDLDLFKKEFVQRSIVLSYVGEELKEIVEHLDYSEYFINSNPTFFRWKIFESKLDNKDREVIKQLAKIDGFWADVFESSYVQSQLDNLVPNVHSVNDIVSKMYQFLPQYKKVYSAKIKAKWNNKGEEIKNVPLSTWSELLDTNAETLHNQFPVMIIDRAFYKKYGSQLISATDHVYSVNEIPSKIYEEDWLSYMCFGYNIAYLDNRITTLQQKHQVNVSHITAPTFIMNRTLDKLNSVDRNKALKHLGETLNNMSQDYRIFDLKHVSLISYLDPSINADLLRALQDYNVKEILGNNLSSNLLPGVLATNNKKIFVLLEDGLFDIPDNIWNQVAIREELVIAGISVVSYDNYKAIFNVDYDGIGLIVSHIKEAYKATTVQMTPSHTVADKQEF